MSTMSAEGCAQASDIPVEKVESVLTVPPKQDARLSLRDLMRAMARLPDAQRQTLLLNGLEGLSYPDVAVVLDI
jgi:RNA polymerase sigma-70 factor, ECF subfamily